VNENRAAVPARAVRQRTSPPRARAERLGAWTRAGALLLIALPFALPLLWLLIAPGKTDDQLVNLPPLAPGTLTNYLQAWKNVVPFNDYAILGWAVNSLLYAGLSVLLAAAVSLPAGYALAMTRFRGRGALLTLTLITMIMPASALVLPLFLGVSALKLSNTLWSVVLPSAFFPFGVYLSFVYFAISLPRDLLNAARVDGCGELRLFFRIALPLARPALALVAFLNFVASWNNYFLPYVLLSDDRKFNLPVGLAALISGTPALNPGLGGSQLDIKRPEVALAALLVIVPIVLIFLFAQRYVRSGLLTGAEKG